MEEKKKNKGSKIFWYTLLFFLIAFIALYISEATGYYEFAKHKQVELNQVKIEEFEQDVKAGKEINVKDYIEERDISYQNKASNIGSKLSEEIENLLQGGLKTTFDFLETLINGK
jgi:hypothetical protein